MVEFGLKLSDNKVEEWSHAYIDYELLKGLIKAAQKAERAREDLEARNVGLAAEIKVKLNNDENSSIGKIDSDLSLNGDFQGDASETVSLLSFPDTNSNPYGSNSANPSNHGSVTGSNVTLGNLQMKRTNSESSLAASTVLENVTKSVTGYFQRHGYEHKLKKALIAENEGIKNFQKKIYEEADKVNDVYHTVLKEMSCRLDYLVESVSTDSFIGKKKRKNWRKEMRMRMSTLVQHQFIDTNVDIEGIDDSDDDFEDLTESQRQVAKNEAHQVMKETDSVRRAMIDLHRRSKMLANFQIMNSTGFIKIIKKFDKSFPQKKGSLKEVLTDGFVCNDGKCVHALSERMERLFAKWFCGGNMTEARSLLLPKKGDGLDMDWSQLRLGYRLGMCSILAIWVAWDCVWGLVQNGHSTIGGRTAFPVFRACGGLLLVHWFWGMSVYIWNRFRINYIFLFDFDPRIVHTPVMIFEAATDETLVFLILMLLYYKSGAHDIPDIIPPGGYPFILVLFTLKRLIFPLKVRVPLWQAIFKVITAPITKPTFFHTYCADVFTSMVKVFQDILWTGCFFVSGDFLITERDGYDGVTPKNWHKAIWYKNIVIPMICLFPLWIRFCQCLRRYIDTGKRNPNLPNAGKYALSQAVTLFGAFHPLYLMHVEKVANINHDDTIVEMVDSGQSWFDVFWMLIFVSSSLYSYFWDVRMDWGLGRLKNGMLGTRLMFPKKYVYYLVMVVDLFLRFMWVTTLIPPQSGAQFEIPQYLSMVTMAVELARRTIWGFFRLEHEHRHNSQGFRRVDFVPLHFGTGSSSKDNKTEHVGWSVLGEVVFVTLLVVSIGAWSVISAQKATNGMALAHDNDA